MPIHYNYCLYQFLKRMTTIYRELKAHRIHPQLSIVSIDSVCPKISKRMTDGVKIPVALLLEF